MASELFLAQCRDRNRNALHVGATELRRSDSDRFDGGAKGGCGLCKLQRRDIGFGLHLGADDAGDAGGIAVGGETAAFQKAVECCVRRKSSAHADGARTFDGGFRNNDLRSGLRHIGGERIAQVARREY